MTHRISPRLLVALCLGLAFVAGCGRAPEPSPTAGRIITVAVIPRITSPIEATAALGGAHKAAAELGLQMEWHEPAESATVAGQIAVLNKAVADGVNAILLAPVDGKALAPHVRAATGRGISVVIFDSALEGREGIDFLSFITTSEESAGAGAAQTLMRLIGDGASHGGKILLIRSAESAANISRREDSFVETLTREGKLELLPQLFTDGTVAGAQRVAESVLGKLVKDDRLELDGIFASSQPVSEGVFNAVKALKDKGVQMTARFVVFDESDLLAKGLKAGVIHALVRRDPAGMTYLGGKAVLAHLNKNAVKPVVDVGPVEIASQGAMKPEGHFSATISPETK